MGHAPVHIVFTAMIIFQAVLATPASPRSTSLKLHAWVQDKAWTEDQVDVKLAARPFQGEPCFCFETALKLFYHSNLVYDIDEVDDTEYTLDVALNLYSLTQHQILWYHKQDAKCLVTWDKEKRTVVFSFRGTASLVNVLADLKVWRGIHPPKRGTWVFGNQPMVHRGFLETWEDSGLKEEVLAVLTGLLLVDDDDDGETSTRAPWRVLTTGHSLGGALAHLASYDIADTFGARVKLTCVTFGAPRPGNHAFAHGFRSLVSDAWDVFHSDDAVAVHGKFIILYKRAANTVIVSKRGEVVVRPTNAERYVRRGLSAKLSEHLLGTYARSLAAILKTELAEITKYEKEHGGLVLPAGQSFRDLFNCAFVQAVLLSTKGLRQASLLRLTGASVSSIERAEKEEISSAAASKKKKKSGSGDVNSVWWKIQSVFGCSKKEGVVVEGGGDVMVNEKGHCDDGEEER